MAIPQFQDSAVPSLRKSFLAIAFYFWDLEARITKNGLFFGQFPSVIEGVLNLPNASRRLEGT